MHEHHMNSDGHGQKKPSRGPSSFFMHNPDSVFTELELKPGDTFLDVGCGPGEYALYASKEVGPSGVVYALDKWQRMIEILTEEATSQGLENIKTVLCDIIGRLPLKDKCVDVCLIATVLHSLNLARDGKTLFSEIHRVLKPHGRLAIINCKKEDQPFGPPKHKRLSPQQTEALITPHGFTKLSLIDLGYNYMIQFSVR